MRHATLQLDDSYIASRWSMPSVRGYRAVLRAVLDQAIEDYRRARLHHQRTGRWTRSGAEARDWLFGVPTDPIRGLTLERICQLLGLEADDIRRRARGHIVERGQRRNFARGARADRALGRRWMRRRNTPYELKRGAQESAQQRQSLPESQDDAA